MGFKRYENDIKEMFTGSWQALSTAQVNDFFEQREVQDLLRERYRLYLDANHILRDTGSVSSVAHCLAMMY